MGLRRKGQSIHGWVNLDKSVGISSAQAVARVRRIFDAAKAGHAGTLDPLASGVLPIALGEATKTVPYLMAHDKAYRFTVRWGVATETDDKEGPVVATSDIRPTGTDIEHIATRFAGRIQQMPPAYSSVKIDGRRAYRLARQGKTVAVPSRCVTVARLVLIARPNDDHATFEATVSKGTYIRALARDLGYALGTLGHVTELRRLAVGGFGEDGAISLENLEVLGHSGSVSEHLLSVETALDDIPALAVTAAEAASLRHGQLVTSADQAFCQGVGEGATIRTVHGDRLVAFAQIRGGRLKPIRVLNFD
jgi:tRNA pseudouridine55 synthase